MIKPIINKPIIWITILIALILIFAIIYFILGINSFQSSLIQNENLSFIDALYFSIVTITTLGFGDISPISSFAKLLVGLETLTGVFTAGGFLNSIFHRLSKLQEQNQKSKESSNQFKRLFRFLNPKIDIYVDSITIFNKDFLNLESNDFTIIEFYKPLYLNNEYFLDYRIALNKIIRKRESFILGIDNLKLNINYHEMYGLESIFQQHNEIANRIDINEANFFIQHLDGHTDNDIIDIVNSFKPEQNSQNPNYPIAIEMYKLYKGISADLHLIKKLKNYYFEYVKIHS